MLMKCSTSALLRFPSTGEYVLEALGEGFGSVESIVPRTGEVKRPANHKAICHFNDLPSVVLTTTWRFPNPSKPVVGCVPLKVHCVLTRLSHWSPSRRLPRRCQACRGRTRPLLLL